MDYEPLDLSAYYNAGKEAYVPDPNFPDGTWRHMPQDPPTGRQAFHGLPFQIGSPSGEGPCYIALGQGHDLRATALSIPIQRRATHVIFAHALLETRLWQGAGLGATVVRYCFSFDDGEVLEVPIRERFEVGNIPLPWGQYPFLAVPDEQQHLADRFEGRWEEVGERQSEASQGWPHGYYLWAWRNPRPEATIETFTVVPGTARFILAGITLSQVPEWPFVRQARRPVKITLKDKQAAERPFDLQVHVDRGVAAYPYPLPPRPLDEETPQMSGFGAPPNEQSSPAYSEIAAVPSATVTVRQDGAELACAGWQQLQEDGAAENDAVRLEIIDPGKNWVKVTVVDDATGQPLPCRVAFHSAEGVPYAPHGHHAPLFSNMDTWHVDVGGDVRLGQITYAYIDGKCEGWLPRGRVLVDAACGYEYEPLRDWVEIAPGQQRLTVRLRRWIDMNARRFFSGDSHVHFLSAQGSHAEAAGEDLNVVNLLQSQWGHLFTNTEEFTGRPHLSPDGRRIVYVSQENRQHILGHLTLLGLKEPVMPWGSGGPGEAELGGALETTLSHWADACHAQGGAVVIPHLPTPNGEPAALIATGRADAVEMLEHLTYEHLEYYRYLNAGYRLPLVGGTDKMSANTPVGLYRTYVHIPEDEPFTYENWCKAMRAGRTFVSGGALIWLKVEGQSPGSTLRVAGGGSIEVTAEARSIFPLHSLQIVVNGQVVEATETEAGERTLTLQTRLKVEEDCWLAARCAGPGYKAQAHFDQRRRGIFAHTSPVYITTGERYRLFSPEAVQYMLTLVDGGLSYIRQMSPQHSPGHVTHHHGQEDHQAYLESPFHEAREALHRVLHNKGIAH